MTNFDPGGFLVLVTVIPAVAAGILSITTAHLVTRLGWQEYETAVALLLGLLIAAWIGSAILISMEMLQILAVVLSMIGAYAATRSIEAASYGWVLGVVLLFVAFLTLEGVGVYHGVDRTGMPQGLISRHLLVFYHVGLFGFGAVGGKVVAAIQAQRKAGR